MQQPRRSLSSWSWDWPNVVEDVAPDVRWLAASGLPGSRVGSPVGWGGLRCIKGLIAQALQSFAAPVLGGLLVRIGLVREAMSID